jgi:hypothetical protein
MALRLVRSAFYHIEGTGGEQLRSALAGLGIAKGELGERHAWPSKVAAASPEAADLCAFTFVTHPLEWLKARWSRMTIADAVAGNVLTFESFLKGMLSQFPEGPATSAFQPFLAECKFIGRMESANDDLAQALKSCGETFDASGIAVLPLPERAANTGKLVAAKASKAVLKEVMAAEKDLCERFGYTDIPPGLVAPAVSRARAASPANDDASALTAELEACRRTLAEAVAEADRWRIATADRERELAETISQREALGIDLIARTDELIANRKDLVDRTQRLEAAVAELEELKSSLSAAEPVSSRQ